MRSFDLIIAGGGLVGASLALALRRSGLAVALIESSAAQTGAGDSRAVALSPASVEFLDAIGVWQGVEASRRCAVCEMRIHGDDEHSMLELDASDGGLAALAWIVRAGDLRHALWAALERDGAVQLSRPARPIALDAGGQAVTLDLDSGERLGASLAVGADGANSWIRSACGIGARVDPYHEQALVAEFSCERSHRGAAWQWFRADGVLAWLPLPGDRISMVWSTADAHAAELMALPDAQFATRVAEAGGHALGALSLLTQPMASPLQRVTAEAMIGPRVALAGDAAHVVHPLAGLGVNLGFADALALTRAIAARPAGIDAGDPMVLRRYQRLRAEDILAVRWLTDGLRQLYSAHSPALVWARNRGLNLLDDAPVIKGMLVRRAAR